MRMPPNEIKFSIAFAIQAPTSYMVFDGMPDAYLSFDMSVSFRPESPDGLILYNGLTKETRDFMSLALIGGVPEFR